MTSAMPRMAAASCNSRVRTLARSPSGTSAGSLIDPRSPRDAQSSTILAPASARRASVPPHDSDSSSGWANTARIVRPPSNEDSQIDCLMFWSSVSGEPSLPLGTMRLEDTFVYRQIPINHPRDAEPRHRPLADAAAIEIEHPRQLVDHLFQILEHDPRHAVVDDLAHR